jgi:hypothetical protein
MHIGWKYKWHWTIIKKMIWVKFKLIARSLLSWRTFLSFFIFHIFLALLYNKGASTKKKFYWTFVNMYIYRRRTEINCKVSPIEKVSSSASHEYNCFSLSS